MVNNNLIIDNGLLVGKSDVTIKLSGTLDFKKMQSEILEAMKEFNDSEITYKKFLENLFLILGYETSEPKPGFLLLINPESPSDYVSVVLLLENTSQENLGQLNELLFTSLSYAANYHGVRFGILAKENQLLICDFSDENFQNHYLALDLSILKEDHDICGISFVSLLFGYINSFAFKSQAPQTNKKSRTSKIPNRRKYSDNPHVTELIKLLEEKIFSLDDGIQMIEKVAYTSYEMNNSKICEINIQTQRLKIWVPLTIDEIKDPKISVRDVREIGHYGTGDTEINFSNSPEIDIVFEIIEQSFRRLMR